MKPVERQICRNDIPPVARWRWPIYPLYLWRKVPLLYTEQGIPCYRINIEIRTVKDVIKKKNITRIELLLIILLNFVKENR